MSYQNINNLRRKIEKEIEENFDNEKAIEEYNILKEKYEKTKDETIKDKMLNIKSKIVYNNYPLVISIAREYEYPSRMSIYDLISFGTIGLINSIEQYKVNPNTKFSTYASYSIDHQVSKEISTWYGEGSEYYGAIIKKYRHMAISLFGGIDSIYDEDIVDYILEIMLEKKEIRPRAVKEIRSRLLSTKPTEKRIIENVKNNDEEEFDRTSFIKEHKEELFSVLTKREKEIVQYINGINVDKPYLIREVGKIYGVSHQYISKQYSKALIKMRNVANKYL